MFFLPQTELATFSIFLYALHLSINFLGGNIEKPKNHTKINDN